MRLPVDTALAKAAWMPLGLRPSERVRPKVGCWKEMMHVALRMFINMFIYPKNRLS